MANATMGETISALRKAKGMTQKELADQMHVTDKAVSKWERNMACPDLQSLPHLAEVLGVSHGHGCGRDRYRFDGETGYESRLYHAGHRPLLRGSLPDQKQSITNQRPVTCSQAAFILQI